MSRLPPVNETASPDAAAVFAQIEQSRGSVSNVLRSFGHAPEGLRAFAAYGEYVRYRTGLDARLRELVILALVAEVGRRVEKPLRLGHAVFRQSLLVDVSD